MSEHISAVTDANFDQEVKQASHQLPVLVDFWAEWCGPCRMIAPVLEQVAAENAGRLKVVKLNVDESPQTATAFGIRSIPTLLVFKNGQIVAGEPGAKNKSQLTAFVNPHLNVA